MKNTSPLFKDFVEFYSPKTCDVLILVDHLTREIDFAKMLKKSLKLQNIYCLIATTKCNFERLPFLYTANVVVTPWMYSSKQARVFSRIENRQGKQALLINLHAEQITGKASSSFLLPRSSNEARCIHISWSNQFTNLLIKHGVAASSIIETKNPKLDEYLIEKDECHCQDSSKQILIIANAFHLLTEYELKLMTKNKINIRPLCEAGRKNFVGLINILPALLDRYQDISFVYRPHPSFATRDLNHESLKLLSSKFRNFSVRLDQSIKDEILRSCMLLSFHSTSYLEALAAKKIYTLIRFSNLSTEDEIDDLLEWPYKVSNFEELTNLIEEAHNTDFNYLTHPEAQNHFDRLEHKYFLNSMPTAKKVATFIANLSTQQGSLKMSSFDKPVVLCLFIAKFIANLLSLNSYVQKLLISTNKCQFQNLAFGVDQDFFVNDSFDKPE